MSLSLYFSAPQITYFDGTPPAEPPAPEPPPGTQIPAPPGGIAKSMTQEEVNSILAKERAKHQAALEKTEQTYKELLANSQNLSTQERATLEQSLEMIQGQLRTKEQQALLEKKQLEDSYQKQLADANAQRQQWEQRYHEETIERMLLDAAGSNDAYSPNQVSRLLKDAAKLVPVADPKTGKPTGKYSVMVELPMTNPETGEVTIGTFSPNDAVKQMKENPEHANLFKANVVGGLGANSGMGGMQPGSNGRIDPTKLTHEQYRKLRKENPSALGLRSGGGRG